MRDVLDVTLALNLAGLLAFSTSPLSSLVRRVINANGEGRERCRRKDADVLEEQPTSTPVNLAGAENARGNEPPWVSQWL